MIGVGEVFEEAGGEWVGVDGDKDGADVVFVDRRALEELVQVLVVGFVEDEGGRDFACSIESEAAFSCGLIQVVEALTDYLEWKKRWLRFENFLKYFLKGPT